MIYRKHYEITIGLSEFQLPFSLEKARIKHLTMEKYLLLFAKIVYKESSRFYVKLVHLWLGLYRR